MSLKPRIVEFETKWLRIKEILDLLLSGQKVGKADWMDKFSYVCKILFHFLNFRYNSNSNEDQIHF